MNPNKLGGSVDSGSPIADNVPNANNLGQTSNGGRMSEAPVAPVIDATQHAELESLVGRQGQELGEYRKFFTDIGPLLDKLDKSPEIVQAILDGHVTADLARAATEGKVNISDAQIVSKAHEDVKKDLGKEGYAAVSSEQISKMVEDKAREMKVDFDAKFKERDELSAFESNVNDFIARTPDFADHASEIDKWLDVHDVTDIAVAYYAVKGELSEKEAKKQVNIDIAEAQKNIALNAGANSGRATYIVNNADLVDTLISGKSNPNVF